MKLRPERTIGTTHVIETGCGKMYLTIAQADSYQEVFLKLGKAGGCPAAWLDGIGRLITFALNEGVEVEVIIKALVGIRCPSPKWISQDNQVLSCPDAIAKVLKEWKEEKEEETKATICELCGRAWTGYGTICSTCNPTSSPTSPTASETQSS